MLAPELPSLECHDMIHRPWTTQERQIVLRGVFGRVMIAIEPLVCAAVFLGFTIALILTKDVSAQGPGERPLFSLAQVVSPIFGLAALGFAIYTIVVMYSPLRALRKTFDPIFIVDGYVRYRAAIDIREPLPPIATYYIAVLDHSKRLVHEWPLYSPSGVHDGLYPALIEFSEFGGVHRIDGHGTGVLPEAFMPFGVGNFIHGSK